MLAAGKTPMIPTISYTADAGRNAVIPSYNAEITQLYAEFPQIVRGPDLWTFFSARLTCSPPVTSTPPPRATPPCARSGPDPAQHRLRGRRHGARVARHRDAA